MEDEDEGSLNQEMLEESSDTQEMSSVDSDVSNFKPTSYSSPVFMDCQETFLNLSNFVGETENSSSESIPTSVLSNSVSNTSQNDSNEEISKILSNSTFNNPLITSCPNSIINHENSAENPNSVESQSQKFLSQYENVKDLIINLTQSQSSSESEEFYENSTSTSYDEEMMIESLSSTRSLEIYESFAKILSDNTSTPKILNSIANSRSDKMEVSDDDSDQTLIGEANLIASENSEKFQVQTIYSSVDMEICDDENKKQQNHVEDTSKDKIKQTPNPHSFIQFESVNEMTKSHAPLENQMSCVVFTNELNYIHNSYHAGLNIQMQSRDVMSTQPFPATATQQLKNSDLTPDIIVPPINSILSSSRKIEPQPKIHQESFDDDVEIIEPNPDEIQPPLRRILRSAGIKEIFSQNDVENIPDVRIPPMRNEFKSSTQVNKCMQKDVEMIENHLSFGQMCQELTGSFSEQPRTSQIPIEIERETSAREEKYSIPETSHEIIKRIEDLQCRFLEAMEAGKPLIFEIRNVKSWANTRLKNNIFVHDRNKITRKTISFSNKNTHRSFCVMYSILMEIHKNLADKTTCTKRELYYKNVPFYKNQGTVQRAINNICAMFNCQESDLGVMASVKGQIFGDVKIIFVKDEIDCRRVQLIPQNVNEIVDFETNAEFVLIVEKDTVFQKFTSDAIGKEFCKNIILITAKGYPDISTRLLVKKISDIVDIPIYILVDADPYGIEIMCTYKFGSLNKIFNAEDMAVPKIQHIGVMPSDIDNLAMLIMDTTKGDLKKIDELLERPYVVGRLREELFWLKTRKKKAEIENLYELSMDFLFNDYIPGKVVNLESLTIEEKLLSEPLI